MLKKILLICALPTILLSQEPIVNSANAFGFDLIDQVNQLDKGEKNWVYSPFSLFSCLSMAAAGAKKTTLEGMQKALHLPNNDIVAVSQALAKLSKQLIVSASAKDCTLNMQNINGIFADQDTMFLPAFQKIVETDYQANIQSVDFSKPATTELINTWVKTATKDKIRDLIQTGDIDSTTRLVLLNAIYFSGQWTSPFSKEKTREKLFTSSKDNTSPVNMMQQMGTFSYFKDASTQILALPLSNCNNKTFSPTCLIILPDSTEDLKDIEKTLNPQMLSGWLKATKPTLVDVNIPRFCVRKRIDMQSILTALGMTDAFSSGADFSGIDGSTDLFLSKVLHEAFFDFNERGIEAAAATAAAIGIKSTGPSEEKPILFQADHPFLFLLLDQKSETILFIGRFYDPVLMGCE